MADAMKGVHARLTEIVHYVQGVNGESMFDGQFTLDAKDRARVRRLAAKLIVLMDEYDKLDPLPLDDVPVKVTAPAVTPAENSQPAGHQE